MKMKKKGLEKSMVYCIFTQKKRIEELEKLNKKDTEIKTAQEEKIKNLTSELNKLKDSIKNIINDVKSSPSNDINTTESTPRKSDDIQNTNRASLAKSSSMVDKRTSDSKKTHPKIK